MSKKLGEYIEANVSNIAKGDVVKALNKNLCDAFEALHKYQGATGDFKSKAKVSMDLTIHRDENDYVTIDFKTGIKTPTRTQSTMVRAGGKRLLLDDDTKGASLNGTDQLQMFDRNGNPTHKIDTATGEVIEEEEDAPAGKIGG